MGLPKKRRSAMRVWVLLALVGSSMLGCGSADEGTPWVGTWRYLGASCTKGVSYMVQGQTATMVLGEKKGTTTVVCGGSCTVTMQDYLITPVGDGRFEFPTSTSEKVSCQPNPCTCESTVTMGSQSQKVSMACPKDFPPTATGLSPGRVENGMILADLDMGGGVVCTSKYAPVSR